MHIDRLVLNNFRNYQALDVRFTENVNVFYGSNAQGKTNVLEGIYIGAMGKSFKRAFDKDLVRFGENAASVGIGFHSGQIEMTNKIEIYTDKKRKIYCDGVEIKTRAEMLGRLGVVLFTPEDMGFVKDGPDKRRKFLDFSISQLRKSYLFAFYHYQKTLEQKSKLLKSDCIDKAVLEAYNDKLSQYSSVLYYYRGSFLKTLEYILLPIYHRLSSKKETLKIFYKKSIKHDSGLDKKEIQDIVCAQYQQCMAEEIAQRACLYGPHRDDLIFYIGGKNVRNFGSQGQQRSLVLTLKLALMEIFQDQTGEYPILLLDDVASELDKHRRDFLLDYIRDKQVFITCTDKNMIDLKQDIAFYKIETGSIGKG